MDCNMNNQFHSNDNQLRLYQQARQQQIGSQFFPFLGTTVTPSSTSLLLPTTTITTFTPMPLYSNACQNNDTLSVNIIQSSNRLDETVCDRSKILSSKKQLEANLAVKSTNDYIDNYQATKTYQSNNNEMNISDLSSDEFYDPSKLHPDHIECLCKILENSSNIDQLENLLSNFSSDLTTINCQAAPLGKCIEAELYANNNNSPTATTSCKQQLLRAKALVLFHAQKFDQLYEFIETNYFVTENHPFLQTLWNEAHYAEAELQRGKKLDPVSRYRVRKKNIFPRSIWDGEGTSYCFKKSARAILKMAYQKHSTPNQQQKQELARQTKLSIVQVSNWFKNQRQRARQYIREGRITGAASCSGYSSGDGAESDHDGDNNNNVDNDSITDNYDQCPSTKRKRFDKQKTGEFDDTEPIHLSMPTQADTLTIAGANYGFSYDALVTTENHNMFHNLSPSHEAGTKTMAMYAAAAAAQMYYGAAAHQQIFQQQQHEEMHQQLQYSSPYYNNVNNNENENQVNLSQQFRLFAPTQAAIGMHLQNTNVNDIGTGNNLNINNNDGIVTDNTISLKYALL